MNGPRLRRNKAKYTDCFYLRIIWTFSQLSSKDISGPVIPLIVFASAKSRKLSARKFAINCKKVAYIFRQI